MAEKSTDTKPTSSSSSSAKPTQAADHDRVVMASRAPDGSPVQHDPEIIGPKGDAARAARIQLTEQAVSVADQRQVREARAANADEAQDPAISEARKEQEAAAAAAAKQAEAEVDRLHEGK